MTASFSKKIFALLPVILFILFAGLSALYIIPKITGEEDPRKITYQKIENILKRCNADDNQTPSSQDFLCLSSRLEPLVRKDNLGLLVDTLVEIFSKQAKATNLGISMCHLPAHVLGGIAIKKGLSFSDVLKTCSSKCSFGCLHGAYLESFARDGNFIDNFTDNCSRYIVKPSHDDLKSCWHITGHGVAELFANNIDEGIRQCLKFTEKEAAAGCISGLRMELLVGSPPTNHPAVDLGKDGTIDFCKRFPSQYQAECFTESGFYVYRATGDEQKTIENCDSISPKYKKGCVTSAGVAFYFNTKDSPSKINSFCSLFGQSLEKDCLRGVISVAATEKEFMDTAVNICESWEASSFGAECFSLLGRTVEEWSGAVSREEVCDQLITTQKAWCKN